MQQRTFHVSDIHCDGCRSTIHNALSDVEGIEQVNADIDTDDVAVVFDEERIDTDGIGRLLGEAGFPVRQVRTDDADGVGSGKKEEDGSPSAVARYGILVAAVVAIAVAGYVGYVLYPRFDLPAVQGAGLLGLAAAAGIASFFSPCSFPLLVGLLGRQATTQAADESSTRPLAFGAALAAGAAVFMLLAGLVIAAGGEALFAGVTFTSTAGIAIRSIVGVLLIVFGLIQLGRLPVSFHAVERISAPISRRQAKLRRDKPIAGYGLFGFGYVLAGFGWTGPILAGLAGYALTVGGFAAAFIAFVVAAIVLVGLVFTAAFLVADAEESTLDRIKVQAPAVKRWGGRILIAVGLWFLALAVFADFFAGIFPVWLSAPPTGARKPARGP